jgi:excisionase family DNA binding protein
MTTTKGLDAKIEPATFKVSELAARWNMNEKTIYQAVRDGKLKAIRIGPTIRISRSYVANLEENGNALLRQTA